ncbi:MAG: LacI family transcriptional regulator [Peptococcaceae bacterium]|nr:LacI family transcriptional regulator [Peptococcaceae bacterium]
MVTIKDVAKYANVSIATVSRALNKDDNKVKPETREKVLHAVKELGFYPNAIARSLHHKKTKMIGLIIQDISNPYYPRIVRGVEDAAQKHGYTVVLANVYRSRQRTQNYLKIFREKRLDGVIICGGGIVKNAEQDNFFKENIMSTVVIGKPLVDDLHSVQVNNFLAAKDACEYLINCGHKKIVTITGPKESTTANDRLEGYKAALMKYGIEPKEEWIIQGDFQYESGYNAIDYFPGIGKDKITAVFSQNDVMAIGVIKALRERGFEIPKDISVIGFDDTLFTASHGLSSVAVPVYDLGKTAMTILADLLAGNDVPLITTLPTKLIIRETC